MRNSETKTWDEVFKENERMDQIFSENHNMVEDIISLIDRWVHRKTLDEIRGVNKDTQYDYAQCLQGLKCTLHDILTRGNKMGIGARFMVRKFFDTQTECHSDLHKLWTWLKELESSSDYPIIKEEENEKEKTLKWIDELDSSLTNEYLVRRITRERLALEASKHQEPIEMRVHISAH